MRVLCNKLEIIRTIEPNHYFDMPDLIERTKKQIIELLFIQFMNIGLMSVSLNL